MNRLFIFITIFAGLFLAFIAGAVVVRFEIFPYAVLKDSFAAAEALLAQQSGQEPAKKYGAKPLQPEDSAAPAVRDSDVGVERYDPARAYNGFTLYTPVRAQYPIPLIDMTGTTVHEWRLPEIRGPRQDGLALAPKLESLTVAYPRLLPNGDLLAVLGMTGTTPWGYGVVKLDRDSQVLWAYLKQAHHDLDLDADGRVYVLLHSVINEPIAGVERVVTPFLADQVAVLSPEGEELQVVSVLDAIINSDYAAMLAYADPEQPQGDLLHVNSITWLNAADAAALPNAEEGDVLLSFRQLDTIAVLDLEEQTIKWALRGPWYMQHDPDILPNGRMLIFDNRGDLANGGTSRVLEFEPRTLEITWEYPGSSGERLYTSIYGSQQRLPNGNTLISESNNGRLLEVTREGEVVWEYKIPERKINRRGKEVATAVFAERFAPESLPFLR